MDATAVPSILQKNHREKVTMRTIPFYKQFRFNLVAVYALLIAAIVAVTTLFSFHIAEKQFSNLLLHEFQTTRVSVNNLLTFVEQTALVAARSAAADKVLHNIFALGKTESFAQELTDLMRQNSADAMILLNDKGTVLARGHDPLSFGDSLLGFDFVRDMRDGKGNGSAIVQDLGSLLFYGGAAFSHPITGKPLYILAGYGLNNNFVDHIQSNSQIDVAIIQEQLVIATTLKNNGQRIKRVPMPFLEYEMLLAEPGKVEEHSFLGNDYFVSTERLPFMQENMLGSMLLSHSQDELKAIRKHLSAQFLLIFIVSLIVGIVVVNFYAVKVSQPLNDIIQATKQIADGELRNRITLNTENEFGLLGDHFNTMADAVQTRDNELKLYGENLEQQVEERTAQVVEQSVLINNILQSSKDLSVVIVDMNYVIKNFNPVAEKIFNYKAEEVLGRTLFELHEMEEVSESRFKEAIDIV